MHRPKMWRRGASARPARLLVLVAVVVCLLTGCGAPVRPELPSSTPSPVVVQLPEGSISLAAIGYVNGPRDAFSLPRDVVISTSVDQASGVTLVFSNPSAVELAGYLRRTLPRSGFTVTEDDERTASLTFSGYGWHGSFTGTGTRQPSSCAPESNPWEVWHRMRDEPTDAVCAARRLRPCFGTRRTVGDTMATTAPEQCRHRGMSW